jgi:hypothetical protein
MNNYHCQLCPNEEFMVGTLCSSKHNIRNICTFVLNAHVLLLGQVSVFYYALYNYFVTVGLRMHTAPTIK